MSLQMFSSFARTLASRNALSSGVKSRIIPARQHSKLLAMAPQEKLSFTEKVIFGTVISVSIMIIPGWVIFNMKEYTASARSSD